MEERKESSSIMLSYRKINSSVKSASIDYRSSQSKNSLLRMKSNILDNEEL